MADNRRARVFSAYDTPNRIGFHGICRKILWIENELCVANIKFIPFDKHYKLTFTWASFPFRTNIVVLVSATLWHLPNMCVQSCWHAPVSLYGVQLLSRRISHWERCSVRALAVWCPPNTTTFSCYPIAVQEPKIIHLYSRWTVHALQSNRCV